MNKEFDESLLSAYLDGELCSSQRSEVEEHLRRSLQARQALKELGEVSALLRALPSESLSEQFPRRVLQAARRQPLLPSAKPAGPRRVVWWTGAGVAAAAVVLWALRPSEPTPMQIALGPEVIAQDSKSADAKPNAVTQRLGDSGTALSDPSDPLRANTESFEEAAKPGPASPEFRDRGERDLNAPFSAGLAAPSVSAQESGASHSGPPSNRFFSNDLGNLKSRDFVKALVAEAGDEDQPRVVEVTVEDVKKGIEEIQRLFAGAVTGAEEDKDDTANDLRLLNAVFVKSSPSVFEKNLAALQKQNPGLLVSLGIQRDVPARLQNWMKKQQVHGANPASEKRESPTGALNMLETEERQRYFEQADGEAPPSRIAEGPRKARNSAGARRGSLRSKGSPLNVFFLVREQPQDAKQ